MADNPSDLLARWLSLAEAFRGGRKVPTLESLIGDTQETEGRTRASSCSSPCAIVPDSRSRASSSGGSRTINPENRLALREIDKDIHRTFPELPEFNTPEKHRQLRDGLLAYSIHNAAVGYAQGLNYICGFVLLRARPTDAQAAFDIFATLLDDVITGYHLPSMEGLLIDQRVLASLLHDHLPSCEHQLERLDLSVGLLTVQWFASLFVDVLPASSTEVVWTQILEHGRRGLHLTLLGLLGLFLEPVLAECNELSEAILTFKSAAAAISASQVQEAIAVAERDFGAVVTEECISRLTEQARCDLEQQQKAAARKRRITEMGYGVGFSWVEVENLRSKISAAIPPPQSAITVAQWTTLLEQCIPRVAADAERLFEVFDHDKDGSMSLQELFNGLWTLGHGTVQERIVLLFREFDTENSGRLKRPELMALLELLQRLNEGKKADEAKDFAKCHSNLDGHDDMRQKVDALLLHLDTDRDGRLSLEEFSLGIRSYPELAALFERYVLPEEVEESPPDTQQKGCLSQCSPSKCSMM